MARLHSPAANLPLLDHCARNNSTDRDVLQQAEDTDAAHLCRRAPLDCLFLVDSPIPEVGQ